MSGILNWAIEGCLLWQSEKLGDPPAVRDMRSNYQAEQDVVGQFIEQETVPVKGQSTQAKSFYEAYKKWSEQEGLDVLSQTMFFRKVQERGYTKDKTPMGIFYRDIRPIRALPATDHQEEVCREEV